MFTNKNGDKVIVPVGLQFYVSTKKKHEPRPTIDWMFIQLKNWIFFILIS